MCVQTEGVTIRDDVVIRDELYQEEGKTGNTYVTEEACEGEEEEEKYIAQKCDTVFVLRVLQPQVVQADCDQRNQNFRSKCRVNNKWCSLIIDSGICTNIACSEMVVKMGLVTTDQPNPYELHWLDDGDKVKVTKQVKVGIAMVSYQDEILCDVNPIDACHLLLG